MHEKLFIGGEWTSPLGTQVIEVISPHTTEIVGRVPEGTIADVERAVSAARAAFETGEWPRLSPTDRIALVGRFRDLYADHLLEMAQVITTEMGSPISFSRRAQAGASAALLEASLTAARDWPWQEERTAEGRPPVTVCSEPVGVVGAIVPWNMPQLVTMSKLAPALLSGSTIVIKPSPETPLDAMMMAELISEAGIPPGVVNVVPGGRPVGQYLVQHPDVDKIAFTGSTAAGREIAASCGEQLKRVSLELGGKSAAVVLDDADLGKTMNGLRVASLMNSGQACVAQTRILAPRRIYEAVLDAVGQTVSSMQVGDPDDPQTEIGPMATQGHRERVEGYIALGQAEGARLVVGGNRQRGVSERGWYVQPTVFGNVDNSMRIAREEIFGPVLVVIPYEGLDEAVRIANDSEFGLAGSVWTADDEVGLHVARRIRTGTFGINGYSLDFEAPFGGFKASGIGREFGSEGLEEYLELKTIVRRR